MLWRPSSTTEKVSLALSRFEAAVLPVSMLLWGKVSPLTCLHSVLIIFEKWSICLIRTPEKPVLEGWASKRKKQSPCMGLIAMLPDTASLVFLPSPVRRAHNWFHCLWIQTCSLSHRNHLFGVGASSGSMKSVSHPWRSALLFWFLPLWVVANGKGENEADTAGFLMGENR